MFKLNDFTAKKISKSIKGKKSIVVHYICMNYIYMLILFILYFVIKNKELLYLIFIIQQILLISGTMRAYKKVL